MEYTMYKFLLVLAVATLTACSTKEVAETTADSTAVAIDTVKVTNDSAVVDSTAK
jgi:hypothetical protein